MAGTKRQLGSQGYGKQKRMKTEAVIVAPKYYKTTSTKSLSKLYKDVAKLKTADNQKEKKREYNASTFQVGQVSINTDGGIWGDVSVNPYEGVTSTSRIGQKISITGLEYRYQFWQQSTTKSNIQLKFYMFRVKGAPQNALSFFQSTFLANPVVGGGGIVRDYNSFLDPDFSDNYKIIHYSECVVPADNYTGQLRIKDHSVKVRFDTPMVVKFVGDATNTISEGQIISVILADNGNVSGTGSTLSG